MKLHETLVQKFVKLYEVNAGWTEEKKLQNALRNIDITVYTSADGTQVAVATEDFRRAAAPFISAEQQAKQSRLQAMIEQAKKVNEG